VRYLDLHRQKILKKVNKITDTIPVQEESPSEDVFIQVGSSHFEGNFRYHVVAGLFSVIIRQDMKRFAYTAQTKV
jgi:hypothetical protein